MRKAPSPQKKSNPAIVWGGGAVLIGALYFGLSDSGPAPVAGGASKKTAKKSTTKANALYTEADESAKFSPVVFAVADAFNPLVKRATPAVSAAPPAAGGPAGIDASITGGEGTWYYTGWVELDGKRQALLENPTTGETDYVVPGEGWKRARIATVDVSAVVLVGPDGKNHRVPILDYGEFPTAAPAKGAAQPLTLPSGTIAGAIGNAPNPALGVRPVAGTATMTLPNGTTVQVPLDGNAAAAAAANPAANANPAGNGGNNGRRRGRRNRNDGSNGNFGGFNNVP